MPQPASNSIMTRLKGARTPCRAHAHLLFFLFGHVAGASGSAAQEGSQGSIPPFEYMLGEVYPRISIITLM